MQRASVKMLGVMFANAPLSNDAKRRRSRQTIFAIFVLSPAVVMIVSLTGCATENFSHRHPEFIVEGDESSYPAFEAAAYACAYRAFSRFPGATVQGSITVGPHLKLFQTRTGPARCAVRWIDTHPASGLYISYH